MIKRRAICARSKDIIEEIREMPTFGPASDHDACQYWANIARELASAIERERVDRTQTVRQD